MRRAFDHARHAIEIDPRDANGHWALGRAALLQEDLDMAVEAIRTAVSLNRNFARAQYSLAWASRLRDGSGEMLGNVDLARRLSPCDPLGFAFMNLKGDLHPLNGDGAAAAEWTARWPRVRRRRPAYTIAEYFRAFPHARDLRPAIGETFRRPGLR